MLDASYGSGENGFTPGVKMVLPLVWQQVSVQGEAEPLWPQAHSLALERHKPNTNWKPAEIIWESRRHTTVDLLRLGSLQQSQHSHISWSPSPAGQEQCLGASSGEIGKRCLSSSRGSAQFPFQAAVSLLPGLHRCTGKKGLSIDLLPSLLPVMARKLFFFKQGKSP